MPNPPYKTIVLYSSGHLGSSLILNHLINDPNVNVVGVIKASVIPFSKKGVKKLKKQAKKVGWKFGWLMLWQQMVQAIIYFFSLLSRRAIKPGWKLAQDRGVPVYNLDSINSKESVAKIKSLEPDLIISAYFNQILKSEVIEIPKLGILNVHPGILPFYRGAMAYFWVLKNQEKYGGVTVHLIDEGIDTGKVLGQKSFLLRKGDTQQTVLSKTAKYGADLLSEIIAEIPAGSLNKKVDVAPEEKAQYFSMPGEEEFDNYFDKRRFFRIRDLIRRILKR
jgi:methionyl-tRNA formyltransferase